MSLKRFFSLALLALVACSVQAADTWYVDVTNGVDTADGKTAATAKKTIQAAVDAAKDGDTVRVAPGVYGAEQGEHTYGDHVARVVIGKALTLEATGGRDCTFIEGAKDESADGYYGMGPSAVRCITVSASSTKRVVIKGFTLRNGASRYDDNGSANVAKHWAGGVHGRDYSITTLVDCTVEDCVATRGGGVGYCSAVRTLFRRNRATSTGAAIRNGAAYNCIFVDHMNYTTAGMWKLVNCTFVGNEKYSFYWESYAGSNIVNCVSLANGQSDATPAASARAMFAITNSVISADLNTFGAGSLVDSASSSTNIFLLFSPGTDDFRPLRGSILDGKGSVSGLDMIPEDYRDTDFYGNPRVTDGAVCVGAVETTAVPATQTFFFQYSSTAAKEVYLNDRAVGPRRCWVNSETWPKQVKVRTVPAEGKEIFGIQTNPALAWHFPNTTRTTWLTLPKAETEPTVEVLTNIFVTAKKVYWTDPEADVATADGSEDHPFRTLQDAADAATTGSGDYTVVNCRPGTYAEGGAAKTDTPSAAITFEGSLTLTNRLWITSRNILFRSTDGADDTIIQGRWDNESGIDAFGTGPAAIRPVLIETTGRVVGIKGFTIRDGATARLATNTKAKDGVDDYGAQSSNGGAVYCAAAAATSSAAGRHFNHVVEDCVIDHCSGSRGGAVQGGLVRRCIVSNCYSTKGGSGVTRSCQVVSSVFRSANASSGLDRSMIGTGCHGWLCTTWGEASTVVPMVAGSSYYGCAFAGAASSLYNPQAGGGYENIGSINGTSYNHSSITSMPKLDLLVVDGANGDFRLAAGTPAYAYLDPAQVTNFCYFVEQDLAGDPLLITADGKVTIGAYQRPVPALNVVTRAAGEVSPVGVVVVDKGSVTLTANHETRNLLGFEVDGEFVPAAADRTFTWTPDVSTLYTNALVASAVYSTNWYVNAATGDDAANGWTPETARKTLVGAMVNVVSGDVVHAAAGVYADGTAVATVSNCGAAAPTLRSRVVVPPGVTLAGEGAETTIIEGEADPASANYGMGPNAVRCAHLGIASCLRGFTLRNGCSDNQKLDRDDDSGGGVMGRNSQNLAVCSRVEDCVVTNCVAGRGAGGRGGLFNRVKFVGNIASVNGGAARDGYFFNCLMDANIGSMTTLNYYRLESCTLTDRNLSWNQTSKATAGAPNSAGGPACNCLFMTASSYNFNYVSNCVFASGSTYTNRFSGGAYIAPEGSNRALSFAEMKVDEEGRPQKDSPLVDTGDLELSLENLGDRDVEGGQRVYNGALDVGAYEYDWRPDYARALKAGGGVAVTKVDPMVVLTDTGAVRVPDGATLEAIWAYSSTTGTKRMTATVADGAVCTVTRNEATEPFATLTATTAQPFKFVPEQAADALTFASVGGWTDLSSFFETFGTTLIFR